MKNPTLRKLKNRGLTPIRYQFPNSSGGGFYCGWIVEERTRGALTIRLVCEDRNRRLSAEDARYVTVI